MKKILLLFCLLTAFLSTEAQFYVGTVPPLSGNVSTSTNSGITFQVTATASIFLDTIYCRFTNLSGDYWLWYSTTSLTGPPNISAPAWIPLQTAYTGSAGNNASGQANFVAIPIPGGLLLNAGDTYRFVAGSATGSVNYSSGTAGVVETFTDSILTISTGNLISYAGTFPTPTIHPRLINGGVFYRFATGRDLRPAAILAPQTLQVGPNNVVVRYQNSAADPILTADLGYQVNNDLPVLVPGHVFASALGPGGIEDYAFTVPINITGNTSINLKVWSTNANGLGADSNPSNDTLQRTLCTGLAGVYTIGGVLSDFPDIATATTALNTCGVTAPVSFLINDGVYYGSYNIAGVPGANAINSISFLSASGVTQNVVLIQDTNAATTGARHHFRLAGVSNVSFGNLTFQRTVMGTALSGCIFTETGTELISVSNCRFEDLSGSNSTFNQGIRLNSSAYANISGNYFTGFVYSIYLEGTTANSAYTVGATVTGNIIENYRYGVFVSNSSEYVIAGNQINDVNSVWTNGYGVYSTRSEKINISDNRVLGTIGNAGIFLINPNDDSLQIGNRVYNNVVAGVANLTTTIVSYGIYASVSQSTSTTIVPRNPIDRLAIVNNTVNLSVGSTSTLIHGTGIHVIGGSLNFVPLSELIVVNNMVGLRRETGNWLPNFKGIYYSGGWIVDSLQSDYNNIWIENDNGTAAQADLFYNNNPAAGYQTVNSWNVATNQDANSFNSSPDFIAPTIPIPTSLVLDNQGVPIPYIFSDIDGAPRNPTTPDIGAYEFVGLLFSQIVLTPLNDTLVSASRTLTANITDTSGLITGPGNGPRMYFRKNSGGWLVDSIPTVSGSNYTFTFDYTGLGGVSALDTIEYYIATLNSGGTVTTSPLGGTGTGPIGNTQPPVLYNYKLLGQANGNYLVGVSNTSADFPTLTNAANFLANSLITGPVNFILIDPVYAAGETFPINIVASSGSSRANNVRFTIDTSLTSVHVQGSGVPALIQINGGHNLIIDGADAAGNRALLLENTSAAGNTAVIQVMSSASNPVDSVVLRNMRIKGGDNTVASTFGIHVGAANISTFGQADFLNGMYIHNNQVSNAYYGVYARGSIGVPMEKVFITNNEIGDTSAAQTVNLKGIDFQNGIRTQITGNHVFNITGTNSITRSGIELGGTGSFEVLAARNRVHDVHTPFTSGANGINIISGSGFTLANNVISAIRTQNGSVVSQFSNAFGIRLGSGVGHKVYYNTVHLYDAYTNGGATGAAASALAVTSTIVNSLEIKNNIFSNKMTSDATGPSFFAAIWLPTNYVASNLDINNNAYHVDATANHYVGRVGTAVTSPTFNDVAGWRGYTSGGNPLNDLVSVPPTGQSLAPFVSDLDLTIPAATVTGIESGAVVIAALGTPNTDFNLVSRPAGTGIAPDMGAYEFEGVLLPDAFPPTIDSVDISPAASLCVATARQCSVAASDNPGGVGVDSVYLSYTINGVQAPLIHLSLTAGNSAAGTWTGTLPAALAPNQRIEGAIVVRDSNANFAPATAFGPYTDDYLAINAGNDTTIVAGDQATLVARSTGFAGTVVVDAARVGGNGSAGVSFNVRAISGIVVDSLYVPLYGALGSSATINVWHNTTAVNGPPSVTAANGWTQVVTGASVPVLNTATAGGALLSAVAIPNNLTIPAGSTEAFFYAVTAANTVYTSHNTSIQDTFTDGNIVIYTGPNVGYGGAGPNPAFHPRMFNGSLGYKSNANVSWLELGGTVVLATGDTLLTSPSSTTTYVASLTDSVCFKTDTVTVFVTASNTVDIGVREVISPSMTATANMPQTVKVVIENFGNNPVTNFDVAFSIDGMELNANPISRTVAANDTIHHIFSQSWTPILAGNVQLCSYTKGLAGDLNLANDTSCTSVVVSVGGSVEEVSSLIGRVYPVPADQHVNFEFGRVEGAGRLEIRDNLGRLVYASFLTFEAGYMHEVKTDSWAAGVYNYRLVSGDKQQQGQLMIRR